MKQLLCLVHDGFLWLNVLIPIIDMLVHWIMLLPQCGLNLVKEFGCKTSEHDLAEKM